MRAACLRMLECEPGHADAHFLLGMASAGAGRLAEACAAIDRAIALKPARAEYHAQHARCLALLRREAEARVAVEHALAAGPADALSWDTIGVVLARLGAHEQAADAFAKGVTAAPGNAGFRYNLAAELRFLGRFDAAEAEYEAALAIDPKLYRAHSALATLRRQTPTSNHIARLTALLDTVGNDVDGELHLRHALAKEHEDLGEWDSAFAHWTRGKAKKRAQTGYSIDSDRELFETVERVFDSAWHARVQTRGGCVNAEPIFVVGMPRSGTTLVERILSSHSQVQSAGELHDFALCVKRLAGTDSRRVLDAATLEQGAALDPRALGEAYIDSTRTVTVGAAHFVDKMPLNFLCIGLIAAALPQAKIVAVRRHPLDVCVSNFRQLFGLNFSYYHYAYDLVDIGRYYAMFHRLMAHWDAVLPGRVHTVRYEQLVAVQATETARLLEHCGLEWQDACLEFQSNTAAVSTASAVQVRERLNDTSIGRWRRYERHLGPLIAQLEAAGIAIG